MFKKSIVVIMLLLVFTFFIGCNFSPTTTSSLKPSTTSSITSGTTSSNVTTQTTTQSTTLSESITSSLVSEDEFISALLDSMSINEKAAQMVQAERSGITLEELSQYDIGSILSGGGSHPTDYTDSADIWYNMYSDFQNAALNSSPGIPIVYGIDAVHGNNNLYGATIFPHNIGLGMANDPKLVYDISQATAEEMLATGITWTFAPALSVVQNIRWGRTYEGFSENPLIYDNLTESAIRGFEDFGVIATAKHFLGDGGTTDGIDQGNTVATESVIEQLFLEPYIKAVEAGVDTVMISYSSLNGVKMHGNSHWINDILKDQLGFDGFVISDYNAIHQLDGDYYQQVVTSVNAGIDMLMEPYTWKDAIDAIVQAVSQGDITIARVNDAVGRILKVKYENNLFADPLYHLNADVVNNQAHKDLARRAVRKSLVLLKNTNNSLPLLKNSTIAVMGPGSDNVGYMCGGWTTYWQGNTNFDIGTGESIKSSVSSVLMDNSGTLKSSWRDADTVIVVLAEIPYAESAGDNAFMTLTEGNASPDNSIALEVARQSHLAGKNVVGILLSGRPLLLGDYFGYFDSFVAAWLPGSEGGNGISDVLFGDYDFTGKLSYTWPNTFAQIGYNSNNSNYDPNLVEFPFGYGLTYN